MYSKKITDGGTAMAKRWTEERFREAIENSGYTLVEGEKFTTGNGRVRLKCSKGHDSFKSPLQIERGVGCAVCKGNAKLTKEQIKEKVKKRGFSLPENFEYKDNKTKTTFICPNGHLVDMILYDIEKGVGCRFCSRNQPWTLDRVKQYTDPLNITVLEYVEPINAKHHMTVKCSKGHTFSITPRALSLGVGCSRCNKTTGRVSLEVMKERLELVNLKLVNDSDYVNVSTKVKVVCANNHITEVEPTNVYSGHGCNLCKTSVGERLVMEALDELGVRYEREKTFDTCKNVLPLPFDFYIEDLNLLIEYDGIQHYEAIDFFGGQKHLEYVQFLDNIKTKWCEENGVELLRIPYTSGKATKSIVKKAVKTTKA